MLEKFRTLLNGKVIPEREKAVTLTVYTRCPEKYKLIDMETGQVYNGKYSEDGNHYWDKIKQDEQEDI